MLVDGTAKKESLALELLVQGEWRRHTLTCSGGQLAIAEQGEKHGEPVSAITVLRNQTGGVVAGFWPALGVFVTRAVELSDDVLYDGLGELAEMLSAK